MEPEFAVRFGLHPWDIRRLSYDEWRRYYDYLEQLREG